MCATTAILGMSLPATAHADDLEVAPSLSLHAAPLSLGCASGGLDTLSCETIDPNGDSGSMQSVFVVASNVESLAGVQFGVVYDDDVDVLGWTSCGGALAVGEAGWPADSTGVAIVWSEPFRTSDPDTAIIVGYFLVDAGSTGKLRLTIDSRIGSAVYVDASIETHEFAPIALGVADVDGSNGFVPCGNIMSLPGGGATATGEALGLECGDVLGPECSWLVIDSQVGDQSQRSVKVRSFDFDGVSVLGTTHSARLTHYLAFDGKEIGPLLQPVRAAQGQEYNDEDLHLLAESWNSSIHAVAFRPTTLEDDTDIGIVSSTALSTVRWSDSYDAWQAGDVVQPVEPNEQVGAVLYRPAVADRLYVLGTTDSGSTRRVVLLSYNPQSADGRRSRVYSADLPQMDRILNGFIADDQGIAFIGSNAVVAKIEKCVPSSNCGDPIWDRALFTAGWSVTSAAIAAEPSGDVVAILARSELSGSDGQLAIWRLDGASGSNVGSPPYGLTGSLYDFDVADVAVVSDGRLLVAGKIDGEPGVACFEPDGSAYTHCWSATVPSDLSGGTNAARACDLAADETVLYLAGQVIRDDPELHRSPFVGAVGLEGAQEGTFIWFDELDLTAASYSGGAATTISSDAEQIYAGYELLNPAEFGLRDVGVARFGVEVVGVPSPVAQIPQPLAWRVRGGRGLSAENLGTEGLLVEVFDVSGRLLLRRTLRSGAHLQADEIAAGVLFVRGSSPNRRAQVRRVVLF